MEMLEIRKKAENSQKSFYAWRGWICLRIDKRKVRLFAMETGFADKR